jgi:rare lipoprotein A (peptidoglycan hydrolase)
MLPLEQVMPQHQSGCRVQLKLMLFSKKILTIAALGSIGVSILSPIESKAISVSKFVDPSTETKTEWETKFEQKFPNYKTPLASVYQGRASFYGPGFYGRQTANGEVFRPGTMTAAHKTLPFGTRVRVTNMSNGRSTVVRINDRGPYVGGRIIDLSETAADAIGMRNSGVSPVKIQILN